jgi:hypothetical protein
VIDYTLNLWRRISIKSCSHSLISDKGMRFLNFTHVRNGEKEYVITVFVCGAHTHIVPYMMTVFQ